ncbi:NAD(P)/FAD-dependent oxidoreductase [Elongatibacter sediminis]|uniref:FAD-dependent oxidoreductase n=1 Tax=Elongatibacter sediminis TaxID=3119006 RepID=A0AAW9REL3_9GAMM
MKIAIIGTGIAGNLAAHRLAREHDITVFEAAKRIGGHTHTVDVDLDGQRYPVDTGFIVYNDVTYPHFAALLDELGVASQPSDMSFSVRCERSGLEYNGASFNTLFAQRRNLLRPSFYRMLKDILRFNREAPALLDEPGPGISLGEYLHRGEYSSGFINHYILPMGAAIWSATPHGMGGVPAKFFIRFFHNHGLLSIDQRPSWRIIRGGSREYVDKLVAGHRDRIRLNAGVQWIRRSSGSAKGAGAGQVVIKAVGSEPERYDRVFVACHSDQALALLADPTAAEQAVLGAIAYQTNEAVLHTDTQLLPRHRRAWAAWNYHLPADPGAAGGRATLSYNMNILQSLSAPETFCVTLNRTGAIDPDRILQHIEYDHPVFDQAAVAAQQRHREINGTGGTYYCGAYWRYGFHEDGVVSALSALKHFEADLRKPTAAVRAA